MSSKSQQPRPVAPARVDNKHQAQVRPSAVAPGSAGAPSGPQVASYRDAAVKYRRDHRVVKRPHAGFKRQTKTQ